MITFSIMISSYKEIIINICKTVTEYWSTDDMYWENYCDGSLFNFDNH